MENYKTDYAECKRRLEKLAKDWEKNHDQLDSNWVCVKFPKKMWRIAKEAGAKKRLLLGLDSLE